MDEAGLERRKNLHVSDVTDYFQVIINWPTKTVIVFQADRRMN